MLLQLNDGNMIAPLSVFDVLETVEEYLGTEVRQYLEDYFSEENPWLDLPEGEKLDALLEHYQSVLGGIEDAVLEADILMHRNPIKRKRIIENLENIQKLIEKERQHFGKESI